VSREKKRRWPLYLAIGILAIIVLTKPIIESFEQESASPILGYLAKTAFTPSNNLFQEANNTITNQGYMVEGGMPQTATGKIGVFFKTAGYGLRSVSNLLLVFAVLFLWFLIAMWVWGHWYDNTLAKIALAFITVYVFMILTTTISFIVDGQDQSGSDYARATIIPIDAFVKGVQAIPPSFTPTYQQPVIEQPSQIPTEQTNPQGGIQIT
jgi:hypothetical protein